MDTAKLTPARIVILAAGAATLVGSFLPFWKFDFGDFGGFGGGGSVSFSAWSGDALFAISIVPALLGLVMALQVALSSFTATALPERVLGLGWPQIHVVCGFTAAEDVKAVTVLTRTTFGVLEQPTSVAVATAKTITKS